MAKAEELEAREFLFHSTFTRCTFWQGADIQRRGTLPLQVPVEEGLKIMSGMFMSGRRFRSLNSTFNLVLRC